MKLLAKEDQPLRTLLLGSLELSGSSMVYDRCRVCGHPWHFSAGNTRFLRLGFRVAADNPPTKLVAHFGGKSREFPPLLEGPASF